MEKVEHNLNQEIDGSLFEKIETLVGIEVEKKKIGPMMGQLKEFVLKRAKIKSVYEHSDIAKKDSFKIILLRPSITMENIPEAVQKVIDDNNLQLVEKSLTTGYENFTYQEALDVLLPDEITTPAGYETIGHIAHFNLKEAQFPYKYMIGKNC